LRQRAEEAVEIDDDDNNSNNNNNIAIHFLCWSVCQQQRAYDRQTVINTKAFQ
jgi:hypothetical protein